MPPRVRKGRQSAASTPSDAVETENPDSRLPQSDPFPARVAVLPRDLSSEARIYTLPHPASGTPCRYVVCPKHGFFELIRISTPKKQPRSWMILAQDSPSSSLKTNEAVNGDAGSPSSLGSSDGTPFSPHSCVVSRTPDLFIATPFDPLFFIIPTLLPETASHQDGMFLEQDEYLDRLEGSENGSGWRPILSVPDLRNRLLGRLEAVCDFVSAGEEKLLRLSPSKLHDVLMEKARRVASAGLPPSLEAKFVQSMLERPLMTVKRVGETSDSAMDVHSDSDHDPKILDLLRLRTALDLVLVSVNPSVYARLLAQIPPESSKVDFHPLEDHLARLALVREQAQATRAAAVSFSTGYKRTMFSEEDEDARAEKKRKKEEEEKRKKNVSRGAKSLKKADVSGMQKMSAFFTKKT